MEQPKRQQNSKRSCYERWQIVLGVLTLLVLIFVGVMQIIINKDQTEISQQQLEIYKQENYPQVGLEKDQQGFFLENLGDTSFTIESISQHALGKNARLDGKSTPDLPEIIKPGDTYRIHLTVLGYETSISYEIEVEIRDLKNKRYIYVYEIKADIEGTNIVRPKLFYGEIRPTQ
ncbi:MAG: hypothetical protein Q8R12_01780 [bacterium]|nr:hypothetical protein [bacterium]